MSNENNHADELRQLFENYDKDEQKDMDAVLRQHIQRLLEFYKKQKARLEKLLDEFTMGSEYWTSISAKGSVLSNAILNLKFALRGTDDIYPML
jgi:Arc/MetJ-type ribon-helix-helix transcriptional regulator